MGLAPNKPRAPSNNPILEKSFRQTRGKLTDEQVCVVVDATITAGGGVSAAIPSLFNPIVSLPTHYS